MKKCIVLILSLSIILFYSGCSFLIDFVSNSAESPTPLPAEEEPPEPTPEATPDPTPDPTAIPTAVPGPGPIREELTPLLADAAENIDVNTCSDSSTPFAEDSASGYDIYLTNISRQSTDVLCTGDDNIIQFETLFYNVTGDLFFDCTCQGLSCLCDLIGGDTDGNFTADAVIVGGTLTCVTNQDGELVSYSITDMIVSAESLAIETNNSMLNEILAPYIDSFSATYLPCIQGEVFNAFSNALDNYIN